MCIKTGKVCVKCNGIQREAFALFVTRIYTVKAKFPLFSTSNSK